MPQNPTTALSPGMRVGRQIAEVLQFHAAERGVEKRARIAELFRLVGLPTPETIGRRYPHQLSGGQQQRVCIAMALACEPDLVVLDEPTTGLDVTTQEQIIELLADLRARLGMSMLYVTHDLGVLAQIADRVGVMYAGRMVEIAPTGSPLRGATASLYARPHRLDPADREQPSRPAGPDAAGLLKRDELPPGCPFQPRCDFAEAICATEVQRLDAVADDHAVACRRWRALPPPQAIAANGRRRAPRDRIAPEHILSLDGVSLGYGARRRCAIVPGDHRIPNVVQDLSFAIERGRDLRPGRRIRQRQIHRRAGGQRPARAGAGSIRFEGQLLPGLGRRALARAAAAHPVHLPESRRLA